MNVFHVLLKDDKIKEHDREFVRQLGLFPFPSEAERATRGPVHHAPAYVRTAPLALSPPTDQRPRRRAHPPCLYPAPCGRVLFVACYSAVICVVDGRTGISAGHQPRGAVRPDARHHPRRAEHPGARQHAAQARLTHKYTAPKFERTQH